MWSEAWENLETEIGVFASLDMHRSNSAGEIKASLEELSLNTTKSSAISSDIIPSPCKEINMMPLKFGSFVTTAQ